MTRFRFISFSAAGAASIASLLAVASSAMAASIGGFSVSPAHFNAAVPSTRAYFQPQIRAGGSFNDRVIVTNSSSHAITLRVDPVDGITGVTSGAVYANRQDPRYKAGLWVRAATTLVRVPAHGRAAVTFVVHVPPSAAAGDHLAGLAFEDAQSHRSGGKFSITEIVRAVIGIEIKVPGSAGSQLKLSAVAIKALPGTTYPSLVIGLANAGRTLCKPRLAVTLTGPGGTTAVVRQLDTVLPGDAIPFPLSWPRALAAGRYNVSVRGSNCGGATAVTRTASLKSTLAGTSANPFAAPPAPAGAGFPSWAIALVGVGGLGAGTLLSRGRRRRDRRLGERRQPHPEAGR